MNEYSEKIIETKILKKIKSINKHFMISNMLIISQILIRSSHT